MSRVLFAAACAAIAALVLAAGAAAAPTPGVYHGTVKGTPAPGGHNEGEGYIRLEKTSSGRQIVAPGNFTCGGGPCFIPLITAPAWFGDQLYNTCGNTLNAEYDAGTTIPVQQGAFDYTAKSHFGGQVRKIQIKGSWVSATKIKGFTRFRNCANGDKLPWTMTTPP
jgi:hypothetical protein